MKNSILNYIILISFLGCQNAEIIPKDYPYVIMKDATASVDGVKFTAEVFDLGIQRVNSHGFVWAEVPDPDINSNNVIYLKSELNIGEYEVNISSGLIKDQIYYVRPFIKTDKNIVYGTKLSFLSLGSNPPEISGFFPKSGRAGTNVVISGVNFGYSTKNTVVKFGDSEAVIDSINSSEIYVKVPDITEPGLINIVVETAGMATNSNEYFDIYFPWHKMDAVTIGINYRSKSFVINDIAYIVNAETSSLIKFNIEGKPFESIGMPESAGRYPMSFTIDNKAYILLENGFYEFDPDANTWLGKSVFPDRIIDDRYTFTMSFGEIGIIGFCYRNQNLWAYNPKNDTWSRKADFPEDFTLTRPVWGNFSFSIQEKGYLGVIQSTATYRTFWKYNADSDTWESKTPLPSNAHNMFACMVINNEAYVGLGDKFTGSTSNTVSGKTWKFNQLLDLWEPVKDCPTPMAVYTSFGLGEKGYILPGFTNNYIELKEVWEFNPNEN